MCLCSTNLASSAIADYFKKLNEEEGEEACREEEWKRGSDSNAAVINLQAAREKLDSQTRTWTDAGVQNFCSNYFQNKSTGVAYTDRMSETVSFIWSFDHRHLPMQLSNYLPD